MHHLGLLALSTTLTSSFAMKLRRVREAIVWLEAILTRDDLVSIIGRLAPMTISLGESTSDDQSVHLTEVAGVSLVGGEGLRVTCRAWIEWPLLRITGP